MGDKVAARQAAIDSGVPIVPGKLVNTHSLSMCEIGQLH